LGYQKQSDYVIYFYIDKELKIKIKKLADKKGITVSKLMQGMVKNKLSRNK